MHAAEDNLAMGWCDSVSWILLLIAGKQDAGVTDWQVSRGTDRRTVRTLSCRMSACLQFVP